MNSINNLNGRPEPDPNPDLSHPQPYQLAQHEAAQQVRESLLLTLAHHPDAAASRHDYVRLHPVAQLAGYLDVGADLLQLGAARIGNLIEHSREVIDVPSWLHRLLCWQTKVPVGTEVVDASTRQAVAAFDNVLRTDGATAQTLALSTDEPVLDFAAMCVAVADHDDEGLRVLAGGYERVLGVAPRRLRRLTRAVAMLLRVKPWELLAWAGGDSSERLDVAEVVAR